MKGKIFCLLLIVGVIFSVSSVCAADLNDTQVIPEDNFIQNDINPEIDCNDNSTDNTTEMDFDNIPVWNIDLDNIGVLPVVMSYNMEALMIEDTCNSEINDYFINVNFYKASDVQNFTIHFDVDGTDFGDIKINDGFNQGSIPFLVVSGHENSRKYLPDFNEITVTISYILNGELEFDQTTFEKFEFQNIIS